MSDNITPPSGLQLPQAAIDQLTKNVAQADNFLAQWDELEKLGVTLPGTKEQLQSVRDLSQQILNTFKNKS